MGLLARDLGFDETLFRNDVPAEISDAAPFFVVDDERALRFSHFDAGERDQRRAFFDFLSAHDMSLNNLRADARCDLRRLVAVRRHLARRNELTGQLPFAERNGFDPLDAAFRRRHFDMTAAFFAVALFQLLG